MFLGEYEHALDDKGRLVMPRKYRDLLDGGCVVTKGQDSCLVVFTMERWNEEVARVSALPRTNRKARSFRRSFFAGAADQTLDKQGRIQVPEKLREYAGLGKDVTIVGNADYIELWSTSAWHGALAEADDFYSDIDDALNVGDGI